MKWFIRLLKNRRLLLTIVLLLVILGIIVAGWLFPTFTTERQVFGVVIVLFLWMLALMYERLRAVRDAQMLEQAMRSQAEEQMLGIRPDKREEIQELQERFLSMVESLKKSKLAKGKSGKAALYALPWYVVIGPPAAGKTTAIANSGLEFPLGTEGIKGVGGTRNCDWFFSNTAILLDTAGRYTTEEEDREEWISFLQMLKKHRRRQPINGVIVAISIADLAEASPEEIERHAATIRRRINELMEQLGVRFPIYLMFTKCDLLQGFVEFFEEFNVREREQIWGVTLNPEQQRNPDIGAVFEEEFHKLYQRLLNLRLSRLSTPMKREKRQNIYTFPLEFHRVKDDLRLFITKLFPYNPYQENPLLRGIYFTSGTQEGVPIDLVIREIAAEFDLPPEVGQPEVEIERKSYFIKDLFNNIIIPDQYLVEPTSGAASRRGLVRLGMFVGAALALLLFILSALNSYWRSREDISRIQTIAMQLRAVDWRSGEREQNFRKCDGFQQALAGINAPFWGWGIYKADNVEEAAWGIYYHKIKEFVGDFLFEGELENNLRAYRRQYDSSVKQRLEAYDDLRAYLLLSSDHHRLQDQQEAKFLKQHLTRKALALIHLPSGNPQSPTTEQQIAGDLIHRQIERFVNIFRQQDVPAFDADPYIVERARRELTEPPSLEGLYRQLKYQIEGAGKPVSLSTVLKGRYAAYLKSDFQVPGIFTREAWERQVREAIKKLSENPVTHNWVLGEYAENISGQLGTEEEIRLGLEERYFREYCESWWNFLKSIRYAPFANLEEASRCFQKMGDLSDSPLLALFAGVADETRLESTGFAQGVRQKVTSALGQQYSQHPVDRQFTVIHALAEGDVQLAGDLNAVFAQFMEMGNVLHSLAQEPSGQVAEYAARVVNERSGEVVTALTTVRNSLRISTPLRRQLFEEPILLAWKNILIITQQHLNQAWNENVYRPFQSELARYYPFNPGGSGVPIDDLVNFFKGGDGTVQSFVETELSPFVRRDFTPKTWEGSGIALSGAARQALRKAKKIRQGLGLDNQDALTVEFSLLPQLPSPRGSIEQITLIIDGKEQIYRMGHPLWEDFVWPGYEGSPGASIEIRTPRGSARAYQEEGVWGWFRLLQYAEVKRISSSKYWLLFRYPPRGQTRLTIKYQLRVRSSKNPFSDKRFFHFQCPKWLGG
ncbi:MAG: type VI secretion system membrane subunit TssM [Calditrichaeota bacterium]|nr:MAG: type VI secretion system membrane subunit TssM [Calditrichota bacterium]